MAFSLDNPGFSVGSREDSVEASASNFLSQHSSTALPSTPSSGDSARRNCQKCHGRMSSLPLDRHSFCYKCCGAACNIRE